MWTGFIMSEELFAHICFSLLISEVFFNDGKIFSSDAWSLEACIHEWRKGGGGGGGGGCTSPSLNWCPYYEVMSLKSFCMQLESSNIISLFWILDTYHYYIAALPLVIMKTFLYATNPVSLTM